MYNSYNNGMFSYYGTPVNGANSISDMRNNVPAHYMGGPNERFGGFAVPFLLGGLVGGAAVGVSRPRPVYVNPGPYPYYPGPYYGPRPY